MDDGLPTEEQVRASVARNRKRSIVSAVVSIAVVTFVPVLRGKGHSPLFTAVTLALTAMVISVVLTFSFRSAARRTPNALMRQRIQRPGESYWRYYRRYLSSVPSHHPIYRRLVIAGSIVLALSLPLGVLSLLLPTGQLGRVLAMAACGLALLALGGAEFLPIGERRAAMILRVLATLLLLGVLVALYGSLLR
jgi:hypothetical protein